MRKILCLSLLTIFVLTIAAAAFGCGNGTTQTTTTTPGGTVTTTTTPSGTTTGAAEYIVELNADGPTPKVITVPVGAKVIWFNRTTGRWWASSPTKVPDSGVIAAGSRMGYTFTQPGTYEYYNLYDRAQTGTVIVE
jgi:plastocyanin